MRDVEKEINTQLLPSRGLKLCWFIQCFEQAEPQTCAQ